jgi:thioredoxin 1
MDNMIYIGFFKRKDDKPGFDQKTYSVKEWPDHVVTLEGNNFNKFIEKYPLSIVDFWAPWCAPCRIIVPRIRRLSKIYKGKVAFGKLDTQKNQDIVKQYKIMSIPYLAFFSYGKKISSMTGVKSVGDIKNVIDDLLKKGNR